MRWLLTIVLFFAGWAAMAQSQDGEVLQRMKRFHSLLVDDRFYIDQYLDDSLSYGHSNGWVENKKEFLEDLGGKIIYHSFREDSIRVTVHDKVAYARFIADVDVTMEGRRSQFHLRVLEVWVKDRKSWKLFARQAIK